jgi:hypothetical protein
MTFLAAVVSHGKVQLMIGWMKPYRGRYKSPRSEASKSRDADEGRQRIRDLVSTDKRSQRPRSITLPRTQLRTTRAPANDD